jgi:hypothetical protein
MIKQQEKYINPLEYTLNCNTVWCGALNTWNSTTLPFINPCRIIFKWVGSENSHGNYKSNLKHFRIKNIFSHIQHVALTL